MLYPDNKNGMDLYKVLKIGRIVILQENCDEDIWSLLSELVWKRMYRVAGTDFTISPAGEIMRIPKK